MREELKVQKDEKTGRTEVQKGESAERRKGESAGRAESADREKTYEAASY